MDDDFSVDDYDVNKNLVRTYLRLLTAMEKKVLALRCQSKKYREIARILGVTKKDIEYHLGNIYTKLKLDDPSTGYNERLFQLVKIYCPVLMEMLDEEPQEEVQKDLVPVEPSPKARLIVEKELKRKLKRKSIEQSNITNLRL